MFCIYCGTKISAPPKPATAKTGIKLDTSGFLSAAATTTTTSTTSKDVSCPNCGVAFADGENYCLICGFKDEIEKKAPEVASSKPKVSVSKPAAAVPKQKSVPKAQPVKPKTIARTISNDERNKQNASERFATLRSSDGGDHVGDLEKLWVPDNFSSNCMDCDQTFGFPAPRRHHCRVCGLLFCKKCVSNKVEVPSSFGYGGSQQRCCGACADLLERNVVKTPGDIFALRRMNQTPAIAATAAATTTAVPSPQTKSAVPKPSPSKRFVNCYELLGVSSTATSQEISARYKEASSKVNRDSDRKKWKTLREAFTVLNDPETRRRHDQAIQVKQQQQTPTPAPAPAAPTAVTKPVSAKGLQDECQVCYRPFNKLGRRQYHCRRCTQSVCSTCSEGLKPIPQFGFAQAVRHCKPCMTSPPAFLPLKLTATEKPPPGFETTLASIDFQVSVRAVSSDAYEVKIFYQAKGVPTFGLSHTRTYDDFEWLYSALSDLRNDKALPNFIGKVKDEKIRCKALQVFLIALMIHPVLRDLDPIRAFCGSTAQELKEIRQNKSKKCSLGTPKELDGLLPWLRYKIHEAQLVSELSNFKSSREKHVDRLNSKDERHEIQILREENQLKRRLEFEQRCNTMNERMEAQNSRMERERQRYESQKASKQIEFSDTEPDETVRQQAIAQREEEKKQFELSKELFQRDTIAWNKEISLWSQHRTEWLVLQPTSTDLQHMTEWMISQYGYVATSQHPKQLNQLYQEIQELKKQEPVFLKSEGQALDEEWLTLCKERDIWIKGCGELDREQALWDKEDERFQLELQHVSEERRIRQEKVEQVEKDIAVVENKVSKREESIESRKKWHEELKVDSGTWKTSQSDRLDASMKRVRAHEDRIKQTTQRCSVLQEQLERQTTSQRILAFDRRKFHLDCQNAKECHEKEKKRGMDVVNEATEEKSMLPEIIERLQADLATREEELKLLTKSNQCTRFEGENVHEQDEYMRSVRKRRQEIQERLDAQLKALECEKQLVESLIEALQAHIEKLQEEIETGTQESELIEMFEQSIGRESDIIAQEEEICIKKKKQLRQVIAESSEWVQDTLLNHSKRKQKEADRLVEQAQRGATLQRLIQRFTSRIISRESRVLKQKRRLLDTEHRVEMLETSEHWYQFITVNSTALYEKDSLELNKANSERQLDIKEAMQLQGKDEENIGYVTQQSERSMETLEESKERRSKWAPIESTYSMSSLTEADEDVVFTSQLRGLLGQLDDSFSLLSSRLSEEEDALHQASSQLETEIQSIQSFIARMESEEDTLTGTEQESLEKENEILKAESQLIQKKSRVLIAKYKKLQEEHAKLFDEMNTIRKKKHEASSLVLPSAEIDFVKKNLASAELPTTFARKFKLSTDQFKSLKDVLDYLERRVRTKMGDANKWLEMSRGNSNVLKKIKIKFQDANWDHDMLTKIPAAADIEQKMKGNKKVLAKEEWLSDLILLKRLLMSKDKESITQLDQLVAKLDKEQAKMAEKEDHLKKGLAFVSKTRRTNGLQESASTPASSSTASASQPAEEAEPRLSATSSFISKYTTKSNKYDTKDGDDLGSVDRASEIDRHSDLSIEM